ncbi:hypothetical protein CHARACLAT_025117 [Characodon lateralis]|uniref:Uncharacterized protein n=1 Tax=Characodon lateralis TaxID=208331 RepID=A0ABU7F6A6_9TELE|nr:hypothetical protein [Characodon lateralis]
MAAVILFPLRTSINSLRSEHSHGPPAALEDGVANTPADGVVAGFAGSPVGRGGFALTAPSEADRQRKRKGRFRQSILSGLKLRRSESKSSLASQLSKQSSFCSEAGMSTVSSAASDIHSNASESEQGAPVDATVTEMYAGEWRSDQRAGWGVSRRSDGLHYAGEWAGNKRHGYGCTTFPDGTKEEGKYKQNTLVSGKRKNLIPLRASKIREKVDRAVEAAEKAADIAKQKAEIAMSRMSHARGKAEAAERVAQKAMEECQLARMTAKELSPSFHIYGNGLECQTLKHQDAKDKDHEVISTGTDSPELCTPDTTPPVITPDLSPVLSVPTSPPRSPQKHAHRPRNACFMRQSAVDDQGGAEIQVLVEGRGTDLQKPGANNCTEDVYPEREGSSRSTTPSLLEEHETQINGHEQAPLSNHKHREKSLSNHKSRDYRAWEHPLSKHASSNHKSREYSSSNHKTWDHSSTNHKACEHASSNYKPQVHILSNHKAFEHDMSNHKTSEHASSNHKSQDYISSNHHAKDHISSSVNAREHDYSNHHPKQHNPSTHKLTEHAVIDQRLDGLTGGWTAESTLRWSPAHSRLTEQDEERLSDYTVDMRLHCPDSQTTVELGQESPAPQNNRLRSRGLRPVREGSTDSVQMLDNLNVGPELEEWPLHRDLTLSPPLKSQPITLEQEGEHLIIKSNSVSPLLSG